MMLTHRSPLAPLVALALVAGSLGCGPLTDEQNSEPPCDSPAPDDVAGASQALSDTGNTGGVVPGSPERPQCAGHAGPDTCWGEWLKEQSPLDFKPVDRGALGSGPWPVADLVTMGSATGIDEPLVGASVDTGENIYAIAVDALYVRRAGASTFEKYKRNTNGLRDFALNSVGGAGPGEAYVGYVGIVTPTEFNDPTPIARSGDIQHIVLTPTGITTTTYDTHNSNYARSGKYDHMRTINDIVIPRRGPAAGEVFISSEHAITRYHGTFYADHRHTSVIASNGVAHYGAARALTVGDDGTMWYGSEYQIGGLAWTPRLYEWYFANPWILPRSAYGSPMDKDNYEGIGIDSHHDVWAGARGHGLVHLMVKARKLETFTVPDTSIKDLVVDLNDTIWLATMHGAYRYDPAAKTWTKLPGVSGVTDLFLDDTVTPRALYVATQHGLVVYRGP